LANPVWCLTYGVFDKVIFCIDTLFDAIESMSSLHAPSCAHDSMVLPCARGFKCGYIGTDNPDHDIDYSIPSHGYLDQGFGTHRARLSRHWHKGYHLA
jgi:hypothetical protein